MADVRLIPPVEEDLWFVARSPAADRARAHMVAIARGALEAADPAPLVTRALASSPPFDARVRIVAAGKAAAAMARAALATLGDAHDDGIVVVPARANDVPGLQVFEAAHPVPDASSVAAAHAVATLVDDAGPDTELLLLLSGGASSLLALPAGDVTIDDYASVTSLLMRRGADITSINTVRKHIDQLKGGLLARRAAPARVRALVLSDVVGDALPTIASGPVSPDPTTYADAIRALHDAGAWAGTPERVRRHLERGRDGLAAETPKPGDAVFRDTRADVIGGNALARSGAASAARALGYDVIELDSPITGEAREAGRAFARRALALTRERPGVATALIAGGETTVTVRGTGRGGRNQELVLGAALELAGTRGITIGSFGTDGIDGPTSVAGAVADGDSVRRAAERGLEAVACLDDNDAFGFFGCEHDLLLTGPTGTNVLDVQVALVGEPTPPASP